MMASPDPRTKFAMPSASISSAMSPSTVAIVGGGPAGLVSAKAVLEVGLQPHLFESLNSLGGTWSPDSILCRPSMLTNISKHTVCFSDFAWPEGTPMFPSAAQAGEYLSAYAKRYLPPGVVSLSCKVTAIERSEADGKWLVAWQTGDRHETASFDYFILACGFSSEPRIPSIPGLDRLIDTMSHTSTYTSPEPFKDKHVAIVGGAFSAVEVATDIAPHVASLHHIIPRPVWVLPRYLPVKSADPCSTFLPLDLAFFRSSNLQQDQSKSPRERWKELNAYFLSVCGDQSLPWEHSKVAMDDPPFVAISDFYTHFVRSGRITPHPGHVTAITPSDSNTLHISLDSSQTVPENITHVIFGTGFQPVAISKILSPSLLASLDFSPKDSFMPFLLHRTTLHPSLPNASFVGCYRGTYWAILELQARWSAALFSGRLPWPDDNAMRAGIAIEKEIRDRRPRDQYPRSNYVALAGELAQELGLSLSAPKSVNPHRLTVRDVFGPHYIAVPAPTQEAGAQMDQNSICQRNAETQSLLSSLEHTLASSADSAAFVASAIFRALHGSWRLTRTYTSRNSHFPSGSSSGMAQFVFRKPAGEVEMDACSESKDRDVTNVKEYLYSESMEVPASANQKPHGSQQCIYRYRERLDRVEVYFGKRDDMASIDCLFHPLKIQPLHSSSVPVGAPSNDIEDNAKQKGERKLVPWTALCSHRRAEDAYEGTYNFFFEGVELAKWEVVCLVKGPKKDYTEETSYTRDVHVPEGNNSLYK